MIAEHSLSTRMKRAIELTAPGTALRAALDMILAAHLGTIVCIGDTEAVLATGDDGFPLNIAFSSNRLFELAKMDGAIVIDESLSTILRANFHLGPPTSYVTSETGMRHRTAARMSMVTDALIIAVSERRAVIHLYVGGQAFEIRPNGVLMNEANQLLIALQSERSALSRALEQLTHYEFVDYVTLGDVARVLARFQVLQMAANQLTSIFIQMGEEGNVLRMQLEELTRGTSRDFILTICDYAHNTSEEFAAQVIEQLGQLPAHELANPQRISEILGLDTQDEDDTLTPLGLRILERTPAISTEAAHALVSEYGDLTTLIGDLQNQRGRLRELGVDNVSVLIDSLQRMSGRRL